MGADGMSPASPLHPANPLHPASPLNPANPAHPIHILRSVQGANKECPGSSESIDSGALFLGVVIFLAVILVAAMAFAFRRS